MKSILYFGILVILLSSCLTNKDRIYLQNLEIAKNQATAISAQKNVYLIQINDQLGINVQGTNPLDVQVFNRAQGGGQQQGGGGMGGSTPSALYLNAYLVDENGMITLPLVGDLEVGGLTVPEARGVIKTAIKKYVKEATVNVKLVNFNVSVLGEVRNPGNYRVFQDQINIFQGLSLAGDMDDFANRKNVRVIRQLGNDYEATVLDLTDANLINSDFFFLHPNDVIIVNPLKKQTRRNNLPLLTTIFAGVTSVTLIANLINNIF